VSHSFDYSEAEWDEIEAEVAAVRKTRLSAAERALLIEAAQKYIHKAVEREAGTYAPPNARARSWAKVGELCSQLCDALEAAGRNRYDDDWRSKAAVALQGERSLVLGRQLNQDLNLINLEKNDGTLSIGDMVELLVRLKVEAEDLAKPLFWSVSRMTSWTGRLEPQVVFFQRILLLWTDFGGKLKLSRDPDTRQNRGPLVRYFLAVIRPVMKDKTPSLQSLRDIVRRQAKFQKWLDAYEAEYRAIFKNASYQRGSTT
jgi:hypothetical protein